MDLDDLDAIRRLDPKRVYASTGMFADQCRQIVEEHFSLTAPAGGVESLVIAGMGGSAYGAHVARALCADTLRVPLVPVSDYHLPAFVDRRTLVLLTSYSGTTEEVLSCAREARERGAQIAGLTAGGALASLIEGRHAGIVFEPRFNPSQQPRLATGYIVTGTLVLLANLGLLPLHKEELTAAISEVDGAQEDIQRAAKALARELQETIPVVFAAQHLVGNAHILRNQLNETSKSFSAFEDIPELNHHLMEGLKYPAAKRLKVVFLTSGLYSEVHRHRVALTEDVVRRNGLEPLRYAAAGSTRLAQVLNALSFGGYVSLYLAFLYGQDPSLIPWVDYFKEQLARK